LEEELKDIIGDGTDFLLQRGLAKLLADRSDFVVVSPLSPVELRRKVFEAVAQVHPVTQTPDLHHPTTREDVLRRVAEDLGVTEEAVENALYADLQDAYILERFEDIGAEALLHRYNLALAQAVLFRASKMQVWLRQPDAKRLKQLMRYIKFFRLIASASYEGEDVLITIDGPSSMFRLSQKYGLQMANFLPALLLCEEWTMRADLLWDERREPRVFHLDSTCALHSHYPDTGAYLTEEEEHLRQRWGQLKLGWELVPASRVLRQGSRDVCVVDYRLVHPDGREAWLELLGFWHRDSLLRRLEHLRTYGPPHLMVAVSTRMRVSEEDYADMPEQVYLYKDVMHPKRLVERAEQIATQTPDEEGRR
jgi:predicted nuclease of restriction endonuclease-like RecB superfamily